MTIRCLRTPKGNRCDGTGLGSSTGEAEAARQEFEANLSYISSQCRMREMRCMKSWVLSQHYVNQLWCGGACL